MYNAIDVATNLIKTWQKVNTTEFVYDMVMYKMIPAFLQEFKLEVKSGLKHWKTLVLDCSTAEVALICCFVLH